MRVLFASLLALAAVLGGCGGGGFQTTSYEDLKAIGSAPQGYQGQIHALHGYVVDAHQTSRGYEVQVSVATVAPTFVTTFPVRDPLDVHERDYVTVLARVVGPAEGINGFGGYQRAVVMQGIAVLGQRSSEWVIDDQATWEAWRAGTLQLGSRGPVQPAAAPVAASVVGSGR